MDKLAEFWTLSPVNSETLVSGAAKDMVGCSTTLIARLESDGYLFGFRVSNGKLKAKRYFRARVEQIAAIYQPLRRKNLSGVNYQALCKALNDAGVTPVDRAR